MNPYASKTNGTYASLSSSQNLKKRRIEFQKAVKPENGFQNSFASQQSPPPAGKIMKQISKSTHGLFDPAIVDKYLKWEAIVRVGPGFFNLGNTCYLNSTLQCLLYTPPLAQTLMKAGVATSVGSTNDLQTKTMLETFQRFVSESWSSGAGRSVSPRSMVQSIRKVGKQFRPMRQEDAHEYLRQLLDCMHEEVLKAKKVKLSDGKIAETTMISRIFGGYLRNELKCSKCAYSSKTSNHFQDLSLEVTGGIKSISDAIRAFTKPEILSHGNEWKCDGCKAKVQASKCLTISKAPNVLVLHLKRFAVGQMFGKINRHVQFESTLDVPCSEEATKIIGYDLVGLVVHHGASVHSGHYVAYVKAPNGQWYHMDDNTVTATSIKQVLAQQAYILFYVRRAPTPKPTSETVAPKERARGEGADAAAAVSGPSGAEKQLLVANGVIAASLTAPTSYAHVDKGPNKKAIDHSQDCGEVVQQQPRTAVKASGPASAPAPKSSSPEDHMELGDAPSCTITRLDYTSANIRLKMRRAWQLLPLRWSGGLYKLQKWGVHGGERMSLRELGAAEVSAKRKRAPSVSAEGLHVHVEGRGEEDVAPLAAAVAPCSASDSDSDDASSTSTSSDSSDVSESSSDDSIKPTASAGQERGQAPNGTARSTSPPKDVFRELLFQSRRGREAGGEGVWEDVPEATKAQIQTMVQLQRRAEQKEKKRVSEWDKMLDQGRTKKLKSKIDHVEEGPNRFQQAYDLNVKKKKQHQ